MTQIHAYGKQDLIDDLTRAGIGTGDLLVVHSSLKSIGYVCGGAETVIAALRETVGPTGGVLFPCLIFGGSVTQYLERVHEVDLRTAAVSTGAIPQAAWHNPEAMRSIHPSHPVAGFGDRAKEAMGGHQSGQGPCGTQSPFHKAAMLGGKILMIGTTLGSCTTLHCVEEMASSYIYVDKCFEVLTVDFDGTRHRIVVKGYCVGVARDFPKIEPELMAGGMMGIHRLGNADLRVIDAKRMIEHTVARLKTQPFLLLAKAANE